MIGKEIRKNKIIRFILDTKCLKNRKHEIFAIRKSRNRKELHYSRIESSTYICIYPFFYAYDTKRFRLGNE